VAYQSLYRRYRPQRFAEVRGQEHLVRALQNAVREGRVGHAYLFSGPRGTGKTSTARILAKVLNCESPVDGEPCGECASCQAIEAGISFDVHELDAASNNKVEDIRELINKAALGTPGRTKVYILDEVHMLTPAASNALLKTLEEPPPHVVFVLATTDPQKVLPTIRSRTQHFEVHLLSADELRGLAEYIVADADLDVTSEAIDFVVRAGAGSARDMESALDQVVAAEGVPDDADAVDELVEALCEHDTGRALVAVDAAVNRGRSPRLLGEALIGRLRDVFLASVHADLSRLPEADRVRVTDQATRLTAAGTTRALEVVGESFVGIQDAPDPRIPLEVALVRLTHPEADVSLSALADRLTRLERGLAAPGAAPPPAPHPPPAPPSPPAPTAPDVPVEASSLAAPDEVAPAAPGDRPAASARQVLAQKRAARSGGRSPRAPAPRSEPTAAPASTAPAPAPSARERPTPAPSAATRPAPSAASKGALPSRDELTLAWGDTILGGLSNKAKPRYSAGRWLSVDDAAVFGFPNPHYVSRAEEVRDEVEAALAAHFGRAVPVRVVIDADAEAPQTPGGAPSEATRELEAEADIDLAELTDASDVASSGVERLLKEFPGAELVEGD